MRVVCEANSAREAHLVQSPPGLPVVVLWIVALLPPDVVQRELKWSPFLNSGEVGLGYVAERTLLAARKQGQMREFNPASQRDRPNDGDDEVKTR